MRTTTRSSDPGRPRCAFVAAAALVLFGLVACTTRPAAELMRLPASAPEHKAAQTRFFETRDANELLSASAAVLQDLGFHIDESVRDLGFLRATKERSARESGQEWARVFVLIVSFGYALIPVDLQQRIAATLVARPLGDDGTRHEVRIMFYRVVWQGDGQSNRDYIAPGQQRVEMIRDPVVYQQFFAKLSKAVFLEAFTL